MVWPISEQAKLGCGGADPGDPAWRWRPQRGGL